MVTEGHWFPLPRIGGKNQHTVVLVQRRRRVAHESIAVQVCDQRGMQPVRGNEFCLIRDLR